MKRALIAAIAAALLTHGEAFAQEDAEGAGPAVTEPEKGDVEITKPQKAETGEKKAGEQGVDQVAETYTVKPGDTLWDLSQRFLGNPWYWPKVWSYNPEVENPHWIYPGNTIRFFPSAEELPQQVDAGKGAPAGEGDEPTLNAPAELGDVTKGNLDAPEMFGQDEDTVQTVGRIGFDFSKKKNVLRQDGIVTQKELEDAGVIDKAWAEKDMLSTYDKVYVRFRNTPAVRPGERYIIYRTVEKLKHPVTGDDYGFLTHVVGSLQVASIDRNIATAIIDHTYEDIGRGDFVGPWGPLDKPVLAKQNTREITGVIVASLTPRQRLMGENHVVFIDKGKKDGVEEGNVFSVIRRGDPLLRDQPVEETAKYPREDVATIIVVDVKDGTSSGLVVRSIREVGVGDRCEMRPAKISER